MKYRQLTKEQFEHLNEEFATFLATQQIDVKEWTEIKESKPDLAVQEMEVFSDLVWEDVLTKTAYIDHVSKQILNLFKCDKQHILRIVVQVNDDTIDLTKEKDFKWLLNNPFGTTIDVFRGNKKYEKERNVEIFNLIEKGAVISKGELFIFFDKIIG